VAYKYSPPWLDGEADLVSHTSRDALDAAERTESVRLCCCFPILIA
jgi:hypothetical protein